MNRVFNKKLCMFSIILLLILTVFTLCTVEGIIADNAVYAWENNSRVRLCSEKGADDHIPTGNFKLFGFIPIGKTQTPSEQEKYVILGGNPVGIAIRTSLYITSKVSVVTKNGAICPVDSIDVQSGDILISIDGITLDSVSQVSELIKDKEEVSIRVGRGGDIKDYMIKPAVDVLSGANKLGLLLQDQIEGIGTMTYCDGNDFYSLGHAIKDMNGNDITASNGNIYNANIVGYVRGQKGKAGELNGSFSTMGGNSGVITANNKFGLYGKLNQGADGEKVILGSKSDAQPGNAHIYTTINGGKPERYEIQIIKTNNQNNPSEKSMVLRVTDKRLLDTTGGIVQGMSGSPIIQNGKLIGAVTHVFVSDPTKGYGIYVDWMKP